MKFTPIQTLSFAGLLSAGLNTLGGFLHAFSLIAFGGAVMAIANVYCILRGGK